jgi:hypothetical protein
MTLPGTRTDLTFHLPWTCQTFEHMKHTLRSMAILGLMASGIGASAQRYLTEVFPSVDVVQNVQYGSNFSVLTGAPVLQPW